jgi:FkbM family methyltransferase
MDLDFIEIGTCNFGTLLQECSETERGISIEPLKHYLDALPNKPNVLKLNAAITSHKTSNTIDMYYIPEEFIDKHNIFYGMKGCNSVNTYHPLHLAYNLQPFVRIERVVLLNIDEVLTMLNVRSVKLLKIDTEGHDVVILQGLYEYLREKSKLYYPKQIQFESNEHTDPSKVTFTIEIFEQIGYKLISRGYDTVLELI